MPLPLVLGVAAALAGAAGIGAGVHGGLKFKDASDKLKKAKSRDEKNLRNLTKANEEACLAMDILGKNEIEILSSFKQFSDLFERIKNKPVFADLKIGDVKIPKFEKKDLEDASVGASIILGSLGGAALGTAGGFAASGATTAAVMALGSASTGTAISALSGAAATNATLAALGGGSLAAGGGGMALGSMILGGATLGVGLLVGGLIFSITGSSLSDKADTAWDQMLENEAKMKVVSDYLYSLRTAADCYNKILVQVRTTYERLLRKMSIIVNDIAGVSGTVEWNNLTYKEKLIIENTVLLVGLLYNMCKVEIVEKSKNEDEPNQVRAKALQEMESKALSVLEQIA